MNLDLEFILIREFSRCQILINFLKVKQNKSTGKKYRISNTKINSKSVPVLKTKCSAGTGIEKVIRYKSNLLLPTSDSSYEVLWDTSHKNYFKKNAKGHNLGKLFLELPNAGPEFQTSNEETLKGKIKSIKSVTELNSTN